MLNSPGAAERIFSFNTYLRFESGIPPKSLALATVVAGAENSSDFLLAWHVPGALNKGVSQAAIDAATSGGPLDGLADDEAIVTRCRREVVGSSVSDETFAGFRPLFSGTAALLRFVAPLDRWSRLIGHCIGSGVRRRWPTVRVTAGDGGAGGAMAEGGGRVAGSGVWLTPLRRPRSPAKPRCRHRGSRATRVSTNGAHAYRPPGARQLRVLPRLLLRPDRPAR